MRSLVPLRATASVIARSLVGLGLCAALSYGCGVDNSGLGETSTKLQRDAGGSGGASLLTGDGGDSATGGVSGAGGTIGAGGDTASGGVNGAGGALGSGGVVAAGGSTGSGGDAAGGAPAAGGSGGSSGTGGAIGTGGAAGTGDASGSGGAPASGGTSGSGGMAGGGGAAAVGGATGTGGVGGTTAAGGTTGTGGAAAMGGATGTGGLGGATGTGGGGGTPCGPTNCMGCCSSSGQCVRTVTAQQCGTRGAACMACGPCQICSSGTFGSAGAAGTCTIDPTSQWTIVANSAQLATSPSGGGTWDPKTGDEGGSAPDPFCEYENPANDVSATTAGVTDTITDTYTPTWDQVITPNNVTVSASALMAAKPAWRIWVGDEDCVSPKNCGTLGQVACSYQQPISAASLMSGGLTISNYQSCVSLTLSFVCQQ